MTAQEYLQEHGITQDSVSKFNITYDSNYLTIPINDEDGKFLFTKSRNLNFTKEGGEPKYKNSAGSHAVLFNAHAVKDSLNIVLCEGEIDCIRLIQGGIPAVSSTGGAGTFNPDWASFFANKKVWICYDSDPAGVKGVLSVLEHIPHARVITLPKETKDICEYLAINTKKDFVQLMRLALSKTEYIATTIPEDYTLMTPRDYEEMPIDNRPWLIDNILYSEGFCFIYGAEGIGKSFITLSMAKAVAMGTPWLDKFPTVKTNVLFLDKENPHSITKRRIAGLGINSNDTPNIYWLKYPEKFALADGKGGYSPFAQALASLIEEKQIGLIIIDSFVDFMVGNESSSGDTQAFFDAIRELYPRIAYATLHHENKPSQGVFRNDNQRLRGSSNINAQTITMFRLEQVAKSKTDLTLKQTKAKDAQKLDKFLIRMNVKENLDRSTTVTGFTYIGDVLDEGLDDTKSAEIENMISELLATHKYVSRPQIQELVQEKGISSRTADNVLKKMLVSGAINPVKKGKEKWFTAGIFVTDNNMSNNDTLEDESLDPTDILDGTIGL